MYELRLGNDFSEMYKAIVRLSKDYFVKNEVQALVLGVSGGIDSALVAALMTDIGVPLIGAKLPLSGNKPDEMERAKDVAVIFCDSFVNLNLIEAVNNMMVKCGISTADTHYTKNELIRIGNIKARMRMIFLYDYARSVNGLVLSTDNFTEYLLGFWTLHGDVGDFAPIQNLWKTEVYGLAEYIVREYRAVGSSSRANALQACIAATPTDGLGITSSDFEQIIPGQDETRSAKDRYYEVDNILYNWMYGHFAKADHPVILRHIVSEFKRRCPVSISRKALEGTCQF
jgi:NAD+ synthase